MRERIEHELHIIHDMGFDNYFLIVWDLCRYAAEADIWWNVRGSGAGSIVAYTLRITNIDPLRNDLIFERFLNPARVSMPDIDIDFPDDRRAEMIEYTVRKYGSDKCAAIITFGTLGARAAVRDVARALDVPLSEADRVARWCPTCRASRSSSKMLFDDDTAAEWPTEATDIRAPTRTTIVQRWSTPPSRWRGRRATPRRTRRALSSPTGRWWSTCRSTARPRATTAARSSR